MSGKSIISNSYLEDIGDAIRYKKFSDEKYYPSQMADAIRSIDAPDEYSGATEVTPSHIEQVLPTTDKLVRDDITIFPAPTEYLSTNHNGTFTPSEGKVGFYQVDVDVQPDLRPLSVSENGTYEPDGFDGFSQVSVDVYPTGYPDNPKDFSGGNILALRSHAKEWINTGYYPKEIVDISCCISKSAEETASQHGGILSVLFPSNRIGNQFVGTNINRIYYYDGGYNMPVEGTVSENPTQFFNRMGRISMPDGQLEVASKPLIIFYTYRGTGYDRLGAFTFYGLKCYEFFKLKKYYVPWLDDNNVPCVHELIDDEYFYNVGTGAFGYIDLEGNEH